MKQPIFCTTALLLTALLLHAQQPIHQSSATSVPIMMMGDHMQMSMKGASQPSDAERAAKIEAIAKSVVEHYRDVSTAVADGYRPYFDSGKMGAEIHYANLAYSMQEKLHIDYAHPGAILYKRTPQGLVAVGVMYSAPARATAGELDERAPLSIAPWHRHVDICDSQSVPLTKIGDPKFGFSGSIHTEEACKAAHGRWIPLVFGWMTHVYPNETNPEKVWGGAAMHMSPMDM